MKYILGLFHSAYFSYIGRFGGTISNGTYYILWPIHIYPNVVFKIGDVNITPLINFKHTLYVHVGAIIESI